MIETCFRFKFEKNLSPFLVMFLSGEHVNLEQFLFSWFNWKIKIIKFIVLFFEQGWLTETGLCVDNCQKTYIFWTVCKVIFFSSKFPFPKYKRKIWREKIYFAKEWILLCKRTRSFDKKWQKSDGKSRNFHRVWALEIYF